MNLLNLLPIEENLRTFFGYAAALSIGYMVLATLMLIFLKGPLSRLHGWLFGVDTKEVVNEYFRFIANFKIAALILFVIPYIAIVMISNS